MPVWDSKGRRVFAYIKAFHECAIITALFPCCPTVQPLAYQNDMKIIDPENLIPYHSVLNRVVKTHPFSPNLYQQIHTITVSEDDSEIINPRISFNHETCGVTLYVVSQLYRRNNCEYILYHEIGHVAERPLHNSLIRHSGENRNPESP